MSLRALRFAALLVVSLPPASALAADYPTKPIRIIVGFGAGSTADVLARIVSGSR